jgi:DNA mismatch repair protein MutS
MTEFLLLKEEFLHEHPSAPKTLFATHYHELNEMSGSLSRIINGGKGVKDTVLFLLEN